MIKRLRTPEVRDWDHAFASGNVFQRPNKKWSISDLFFYAAEKLYRNYVCRRVWRSFVNNSIFDDDLRLGVKARIINRNNKGAVRIGKHVVCRGIIRIEKNGKLIIGDKVYIGDDVIISAAEEITIGSGTLIAHGVQIFDNPTHPLHWKQREQDFDNKLGIGSKKKVVIPSAKIDIGCHCWICMNSIILKGVKIGDYSIIYSGSIVKNSVNSNVIFDGERSKHIIQNSKGDLHGI